jgi:L-phenylalanine/L-methionine N-acetyltransferase
MTTASKPFRLRRARTSDAEAFVQMMSEPEVYSGVLQMPYPDIEAWRKRLESPTSPGAGLHLVAEADGEPAPTLIASAGVHAMGDLPRRRHVLGLGMTVAKGWQGRGVGSALMAALIDYTDRWAGVLRIELTVYTDNARAIALYRRFGFVEEGVAHAYALRDGVYVDALMMARLHPSPPQLPPQPSPADLLSQP